SRDDRQAANSHALSVPTRRSSDLIHNVMETILKPYKGLADFTSTKVLETKLQEIDELVVREIGMQYHTEITSVDALNSMQRIMQDRKSTRLNSSHVKNSYAVFCLK